MKSGTKLLFRLRNWLNNLPIHDPIERSMAFLLQAALIALLVVVILGTAVYIAIPNLSPQEKLNVAANDLVGFLVAALPLVLLRRGYYRSSVLVIIFILFVTPALAVTTVYDLLNSGGVLFQFTLAIILAGLLISRRALIYAFVSSAIVVGFSAFQGQSAAPQPADANVIMAINFILYNGVIAFIIDRFGITLRAALTDAQERGRELQRDITERKQAEVEREQYFKFFQSSTDIMCIADPNGAFMKINPACIQMLGYSEAELISRPFIEFIHPDDKQSTLDEMERQQQKSFSLNFENRYVCKDGSVLWLSWRANYNKSEGLTYATARDITEKKQAEELIRQYANELEKRVQERTAELIHADHAKDEFLANMSHELRTPLNGILGFSETLLEEIRGPLNKKQQQAVEIIQSSGQHLLGLINDILDVSKIESGKFELQLETLVVNDVCRSSLNFIKQLANRKFITVEYIPSPDASTLVADPKRLKQILVNLLNNAVKFTPENGNIRLEAHTDAGAGLIRFSVTDTGIGITPQDQKKLFKPFVQVDSGFSRQYEGTGLGLSLVKKLVEMHGGSVELQSQPGQGSCFTFTLPWHQDMFNNDLENTKILKAQPAVRVATTHGKILLAEDNEANIMMITDYLENAGYKVTVAEDGKEVFSKAEESVPDIVLMDIQMPNVSGIEAARRLRFDPRFATVPIIALTAFAMPGDRERCLEAGMNEYLSKPIKLKELHQIIEKFLEHPVSE